VLGELGAKFPDRRLWVARREHAADHAVARTHPFDACPSVTVQGGPCSELPAVFTAPLVFPLEPKADLRNPSRAANRPRNSTVAVGMTFDDLYRGAGREYLFHYTDAAGADLAIEHSIFISGTEARHGVGIYATDIAPVDESTLHEVNTECFDGTRSPARLDHAIVVLREAGSYKFEQTIDPAQWLLSTGKLERVVIQEIYVGAVIWSGKRGRWDVLDE
jgi:hypothetical protein